MLDTRVGTVVADAQIASAALPVIKGALAIHALSPSPDGAVSLRVVTRVLELLDDEAAAGSSIDDAQWARDDETVERIARQILSALMMPDPDLN